MMDRPMRPELFRISTDALEHGYRLLGLETAADGDEVFATWSPVRSWGRARPGSR
jgi:hypothetical protein